MDPHPPSEHAPAESAPDHDKSHTAHHAKGHKDHKGGDHGGGGGEHGGSWIVTYCDMITLLIAFFIAIITFASKESGNQKYPKMRDSILYGPGGSGIAGPAHSGTDHDSVVWRQFMMAAYPDNGSRIPPRFSDPTVDKTSEVLRLLDEPTDGTLSDSYALRLSLALLLDEHNQPPSTGERILKAISHNFGHLPYDILIQVDDPDRLPKAVALARYLATREAIDPSRLGVGLRPQAGHGHPAVWLIFVKRS